jgi:hypothetical protein
MQFCSRVSLCKLSGVRLCGLFGVTWNRLGLANHQGFPSCFNDSLGHFV